MHQQHQLSRDFKTTVDDTIYTCDKLTYGEVLNKQEGGNHYQLPIQPIDYIVKNNLGFREGNVVKYVTRHKIKNGMEDIRKAMHYLKFIAEMDYGEKL